MNLQKKIKGRLVLVLGIGNLALLTFFLLVTLENNLAPREYSEFAAFWSFLMGIVMGFTYPLETNGLAVKSFKDKDRQTRNELSAAKSVVVVLTLITLVTSPFYVSQIFNNNWLYLFAFLIVVISFSTIYLCRARLLNDKQYLKYSIFLSAEGVARIVLSLLFILTFNGSGIQASLAVVLSSLLVAIFIAKSVNFKLKSLFENKNKINLNIFNLVFANLIIILILNAGPFFIHAIDTTGELAGKELNSLTISRIPVFLGPLVQSILIPKFQTLSSNEQLVAKRFFIKSLSAIAIFAFLWVVFFGMLGKYLVEILFGPNSVGENSNLFLLASITGSYLILLVIQSYFVAMHLNKQIRTGLGVGSITLLICLVLPLPIVIRTEIACALAMFIPVLFLIYQTKKVN